LEGSFFEEHVTADKEKQSIMTANENRIMQFTKRQLVHITFIDSVNFAVQKIRKTKG
jgi:hypothetical protein